MMMEKIGYNNSDKENNNSVKTNWFNLTAIFQNILIELNKI